MKESGKLYVNKPTIENLLEFMIIFYIFAVDLSSKI